jgi:hypothetical protein
MQGDLQSASLIRLLRAGILLVAAISLVGLALELVFLRHWGDTRSIVWLGMLALALSLALLVIRPNRSRVRVAQGLALAAGLVAIIGIGYHTIENLDAGPLDRDYADRWGTMSDVDQLLAATTGDVGPAPILAPGSIAEIAALLVLASIGHPSLAHARLAPMEELPDADPRR